MKKNNASLNNQSNRAVALFEQGRLKDATAICKTILAKTPGHFETLHLYGLIHFQNRDLPEALRLIEQSLKLRQPAHAHYNLSLVLAAMGRYEEAMVPGQTAIEKAPKEPVYHAHLGHLFLAQKRPREAQVAFRRSLECDPKQAETWHNLALGHQDLEEYETALEHYQHALRLDPRLTKTGMNRGVCWERLLRFDEAIASYQQVLTIEPDNASVIHNLALCYLRLGDFKRGWQCYEDRWRTGAGFFSTYSFKQPRWDISCDIQGKTLLLHPEQGVGDMIQFYRYIPLLKARGAKLVLLVQAFLYTLMRGFKGMGNEDQVILERGKQTQFPPFDWECPVMSLGFAFATEVSTIPSEVPYLHALPSEASIWKDRLASHPSPRIGIVWAGRNSHPDDHNRSIPLSLILQHLPYPMIGVFREVPATDQKLLEQGKQITDYSQYLHDFSETAALISVLDVVITVDTSVAHLAGAMAKPVWLLLPNMPDWRWMLNREDSPWYPTMRLFRQSRPKDWAGVLMRVATELQKVRENPDYLKQVSMASPPVAPLINPSIPSRDGRVAGSAIPLASTTVPATIPTTTTAPSYLVFPEGLTLSAPIVPFSVLNLPSQPIPREPSRLPPAELNTVNQAFAFFRQANLGAASQLCHQILQRYPDHFDTVHLVGLMYFQQGQNVSAEQWLRRAIQLAPEASAYYNLSLVLGVMNRHTEARAAVEAALKYEAKDTDYWNHLGNLLSGEKYYADSLKVYQTSLQINPKQAEICHNIGFLLQELGYREQALQSYQTALEHDPSLTKTWISLGLIKEYQQKFREAVACYQRVLSLQSDSHLAYHNMASALEQDGRLSEALSAYQQALRIEPENYTTQHNFALCLLRTGNFKEGWRYFEARYRLNKPDFCPVHKVSFPVWDGRTDLRGRSLLLLPEQGFGDMLQFCRYLPLLKQRGIRIVLALSPNLCELVRSLPASEASDLIIPYVDPIGENAPPCDYQCALMSLPYLLGTTLQTIPFATPYLYANKGKMAGWRARLAERAGPLIGIAWAGSPSHPTDRHRSIPLQLLVDYLPSHLVCLPNQLNQEEKVLVENNPRLCFYGEGRSWVETAAMIMELDLVITVDTSIAHLAGALGRPVWILLPKFPDWRWLEDKVPFRESTPWYPTARLFRQAEYGDWHGVLKRIQTALIEKWSSITHAPTRVSLSIDQKLEQALNLHQEGVVEHAEQVYLDILRQEPEHANALQLLGVLHLGRNEYVKAEGYLQKALPFFSKDSSVITHYAVAQAGLENFNEAMLYFDKALGLSPTDADIIYNKAQALVNMGRYEDAIILFHQVLKFNPQHLDVGWNMGIAYLRLGKFKEGWHYFEMRWTAKNANCVARTLPSPRWQGKESLQGKMIFLYPEQGLGDMIHFARYLLILKEQGARIALEVPQVLHSLFRRLPITLDYLLGTGDPIPAHDYHCPLMSLAYVMGTDLSTIPVRVPYLNADPDKQLVWSARIGGMKPRIGIVWAGNAINPNDRRRSIPVSLIIKHLSVPLWCMQLIVSKEDCEVLAKGSEIKDCRHFIKDFSDTAAMVANLDLVITVDTAVAHLAGAMGKPVWLLLPHNPDWRWLMGRADSPWYPTMRIFRQATPGDWAGVLSTVSQELGSYFSAGVSVKPNFLR